MILTGHKIIEAVEDGSISIEPFNRKNVGPNSVDLTLSDEIKIYINHEGEPLDNIFNNAADIYQPSGDPVIERKLIDQLERKGAILDPKRPNLTKKMTIPEDGLVLIPGRAYLARINETVGTDKYVPSLHGRSSVGRLFVSVHHTAGWGDVGFSGTWTLEMTCMMPVRVYPNMRICQIAFSECVGDLTLYGARDGSKYQGQVEPEASRIYEDLEF